MGLFLTDGIRAIDVTLFDGPPIGAVRVGLEHGLSVLYGENGSGKTTVLDGVSSALTGVRRPHGGLAYLRCRPVRDWSGYDTTMSLGIAQLARSAAIAASVSEDRDGEVETRWEQSANYLSHDARPYRGDWNETEAHHHVVMDQLIADIQLLGGVGVPIEELDLMLVADGSSEHPAWLVYVSRLFEATALRAAAKEVHPIVAAMKMETVHFTALDLGRYGRSSFDLWPLRTRFLGRLSAAGTTRVVRGSDGFDPTAATLARVESVLFERQESLLEFCDGDGFGLVPAAQRELNRMANDATGLFQRMVDCDATLQFDVCHPSLWPTRGFGEWMVWETDEVRVPITRQGSARRRWARFAVEVSLFSHQHEWPVIMLLDEPENALHPAAQTHLVRGLTIDDGDEVTGFLTTYGIIAATHSPAMLNATGAQLLHVHREADTVRLDPIVGLSQVDELVDRLGLSRADVLSMTKSFLLVEGEHDELVLRGLLGDELDRRRARVVAMRGAKKAMAALDVELLARYTDARLVFVIDRLGKRGSDCWADARTEFSKGDFDAAARALHRLERLPGGEGRWLAEAGLAALNVRKLDQVGLVGLERRDVLEYLPADAFVPGATSWKALRAEHDRSGERGDFKDWLRSRKGARISRASILNAIGKVDDLGDLPQVLNAI